MTNQSIQCLTGWDIFRNLAVGKVGLVWVCMEIEVISSSILLQLPVPDCPPGWGWWWSHLQLRYTHWGGRHFSLRSPRPQKLGHGRWDGQPLPHSHGTGKRQSSARGGLSRFFLGSILAHWFGHRHMYFKFNKMCVRWLKLCGNDAFRVSPEWMWLTLAVHWSTRLYLFWLTFMGWS